jgi:hypothetical protein
MFTGRKLYTWYTQPVSSYRCWWNAYAKDTQEKILLQYRLTYLAEWSELVSGLGTVLANDEIVNGVSERIYGGS